MAADRPDELRERPIGSRRTDLVHGRPVTGIQPPPPPHRGGGPGRHAKSAARRLVSLLLLVAALALLGGLVWAVVTFSGVGGSDLEAGKPVTVRIPQGSTSSDIADLLAEQGVVSNEAMFRARLRLNGDGAGFKSGTYKLKTGSSYDTVVRVLEKGPAAAPTYHVTVPEGQRMEETAALIDRLRSEATSQGGRALPAFTGAQYLAAARAVRPPASVRAPKATKSGEGFLFPATYDLRLSATAKDLVQKQQAAAIDAIAGIDMARAAKANLTPYDVVTVASLIEREAQLAKERPLVAAVIWNRLKVGEPLGIDASNQYDVYEAGSKEFWTSSLTQSDLAKDSPYNLRKVAGLPPTPIANPGRASLQAAANPAKVDYRYYVAKGDGSGGHFFTADYDEFLQHQ